MASKVLQVIACGQLSLVGSLRLLWTKQLCFLIPAADCIAAASLQYMHLAGSIVSAQLSPNPALHKARQWIWAWVYVWRVASVYCVTVMNCSTSSGGVCIANLM